MVDGVLGRGKLDTSRRWFGKKNRTTVEGPRGLGVGSRRAAHLQRGHTMTIAENGMSRRSFLSGAAVVGAALAGAGLAGCAPSSSAKTGTADSKATAASAPAGSTVGYDGTGTMPWLGEAPEVSDSDVEEEVDADVVVIGLGAAGVPAARAAADVG